MKGLLRISFVILGVLPLALMHVLGVLLGTLVWWLPTKARRMTLHHLALCLPELSPAQRQNLARRSLLQSACSIFELPAIWYGPRWRLHRWLHQPEAPSATARTVCRGQGRDSAVPACWAHGNWPACSAPTTAR